MQPETEILEADLSWEIGVKLLYTKTKELSLYKTRTLVSRALFIFLSNKEFKISYMRWIVERI